MNNMWIVDRAGPKLHCSSGSIPRYSYKSLMRDGTIFNMFFSGIGNRRNPSVVDISSVLRLMKIIDYCIFPLLGDFSHCPNNDEDVEKALDNFGMIKF